MKYNLKKHHTGLQLCKVYKSSTRNEVKLKEYINDRYNTGSKKRS